MKKHIIGLGINIIFLLTGFLGAELLIHAVYMHIIIPFGL